ncbi:hypothetical protein [Nocardia jejuensis]|uniref:hypothetical protein n=1 Tax=Nocardia jejuensis TaxID=328049 RepID=UPI00082BA7FA|nr:hypothetical protein [Nocardia jejuensis]
MTVQLKPGLLDALKLAHGVKSDRELARVLGVSEQCIRRARNGKPSVRLMGALAQFMQTAEPERVVIFS